MGIGASSLFARLRRARRDREIKRHNEIARLKRLERQDFEGWPLPTGEEGALRLTRAFMLMMPPISDFKLNKAYMDRAQDLGVNIMIEEDSDTGDYLIQWHKPKKRRKHD